MNINKNGKALIHLVLLKQQNLENITLKYTHNFQVLFQFSLPQYRSLSILQSWPVPFRAILVELGCKSVLQQVWDSLDT